MQSRREQELAKHECPAQDVAHRAARHYWRHWGWWYNLPVGLGNEAGLLKGCLKKPQTSQLSCVSKWEWACIIIWVCYPLTATARAQCKAEWAKICGKCSSALSILWAKELELLLWDEAEEGEFVQRNGENAASQSSVLEGNKGKARSHLDIHPLYLELPSCWPIPSISSETKRSY